MEERINCRFHKFIKISELFSAASLTEKQKGNMIEKEYMACGQGLENDRWVDSEIK